MGSDSRALYKDIPRGRPEWATKIFITRHAYQPRTMQLRHEQEFTLTIPAPFDFALTVAKPAGWHWSTPKEIFLDGTLWTGLRVRDIPVGLRLNAKDSKVRVRAFTKSPLAAHDASELKSIIRFGLGADEDLAGFYAFAEGDPVLKIAVADHPGMRIGDLDDVFGNVILAILLQMAPIARSEKMMDDILGLAGTKISFDSHEVVLWPRAEQIAGIDPGVLRAKAMLGYRAERLVKAAQYLVDHPVSLRALAEIPEEEAEAVLTAIPGIGKYSAAIIFGQATPPIDAWSVVIMSELYEGKTPVNSRAEIARVQAGLSAKWGKWSWLAFAYILNDIDRLAQLYPLSRIR
jgi:3-methyladenine DNA glycosylase/8-oxoguanine DNA glycosylase